MNDQRGHNAHLQSAWNKYGASAFSFDIIESGVSESELLSLEQRYIDEMKPEYNTRLVVDRNTGVTFSDDAKQKMRDSKLLKPTRYWSGKKRYPETVEKMRVAATGRPSAWKGRKHTAESIALMKKSLKGRVPANKTIVATDTVKWIIANHIPGKRGNIKYLAESTGLNRNLIDRILGKRDQKRNKNVT